MSLPIDDAERKALPVFDGVVMYFPDAILEIARVSMQGNDQHNPGEKLHWARGKSMDQLNTAMRHMMDHGMGNHFNGEFRGKPIWHLAKAAWRVMAELQLAIEKWRRDTLALAVQAAIPLDKVELGSWNDKAVDACEAQCAVTEARGFWNHARGEWESE